MIVDPETGAIISKGDNLNGRHLWQRTNLNHWSCIKCECVKEQFGDKQFQYWKALQKFDRAPECDNSKVEIITNKKNGKCSSNQQLTFKW